MATWKRTLEKVLSGSADASIRFSDLRKLLEKFEFVERIRGDHHLFTRMGVEEILNIQPKGAQAKPYQVKQVRAVFVNYELVSSESEFETEIDPEEQDHE